MKKEFIQFLTAVLVSTVLFLFSGCSAFPGNDDDIYRSSRIFMVNSQIKDRGVSDTKVIESMMKVPRHKFVPDNLKSSAYYDGPLPIGYGQTISQPYIVALMTELLSLKSNSRVLEIGTGSGYQAAVLAEIAKEVYSVEIVKGLHDNSNAVFHSLGYRNIKTINADGYSGWPDYAPFDAIIVTCASEFIPPPLIKQLKKGGVMCIPVGPPFKVQHLLFIKKTGTGEIKTTFITEVRFVPLLRKGD